MKVIKGLECRFKFRLLFKLIALSVQVVQWNQRTLYFYCFLILNDSECFLLTVHFLKYWFMSNLVQIKSTRNIFGIKKSLKKYLTSKCCIMYTSFQDSMDESGSRPNFGFGMNFESFILKLRNWSLVFQKEGK